MPQPIYLPQYDPWNGLREGAMFAAQGWAQGLQQKVQQDSFNKWVQGLPAEQQAFFQNIPTQATPQIAQAATAYRSMAPETEPPKPPTTRSFTVGDKTVEKQWNPETGKWEELSSGPRFKPEGSSSPKPPTMQEAAKAVSDIDKAIYRLKSLGAMDDPFMAMAASANPELAEKLKGIPPDEAVATLESERDYWLQYAPDSMKKRYEKPKPKPLDEETARQLLKEAGGDKDKARELARKRGYAL